MKLVICNGEVLQVRDVSDVLYELRVSDRTKPMPCINTLMDDEKAREFVRKLRRAPRK